MVLAVPRYWYPGQIGYLRRRIVCISEGKEALAGWCIAWREWLLVRGKEMWCMWEIVIK